MKTIKLFGFAFVALMLASCNDEPSIQEYYVENQEDSKFVALDIPTSLLANNENLNAEQLETLETVKKVNVLAYPLKEGKNEYEKEKLQLQEILKNEKYQLLMKYGSGERKAEIYFTGDEEAIDEFVVFGFDDTRGMGLARILGEDMNPENLMKLIRSFEKGDLDFSGLEGMAEIFNAKVEVKNVENDSLDVAEETQKEEEIE